MSSRTWREAPTQIWSTGTPTCYNKEKEGKEHIKRQKLRRFSNPTWYPKNTSLPLATRAYLGKAKRFTVKREFIHTAPTKRESCNRMEWNKVPKKTRKKKIRQPKLKKKIEWESPLHSFYEEQLTHSWQLVDIEKEITKYYELWN